MRFWKALAKLAVASSLLGAVSTGSAQNVTRILVPYGPGGSTDIAARLLARELGRIWGSPVIVENRAGAAGMVASHYLTTQPPDGKTLLIVTSAHAINELVRDKLRYDTLKDFTPIAQVTNVPNVLMTSKDSKYKNLADVVSAGKEGSSALFYATGGAGSSVHLAGELLSSMAKIKMVPVHFKGDADSVVALMGGHVPLSFNTLSGALTQIKAGTVRTLAVTGAQRLSILKNVPTVAESGFPNYAVNNWAGILGPANMDPALVVKLNEDIQKVLADPTIAEKFEENAMFVKTGTPADFDQLIRTDMEKWRPIISKINLRLE